MHVRDAVEADAAAIASLADQPTAAARNLVHDRSVRVGVAEAVDDPDPDPEPVPDLDPEPTPSPPVESEDLLGFVAFDAEPDAVHVTGFGGTQAAVEELLGEPIRFAAREGMVVEALVEADETDRRSAIEGAGFEDVGAGPQFDGSPTRRYQLDPDSVDAVGGVDEE
ncbi:hypothetical protein [Haloparvum sp. PAK95]|uniref:hypothetical protein n=1 Tax=Haloparvum sp. PAK95 TaxID=3418962 RepID=UPI003D2F33F1